MALITLDKVSKIYPKGTRPALDHINLDIERGDFVFLVGASGSGKTTLLSLLLREEEATDGEIRVAGNDLRRLNARQIPQYRRSIGFIFQDYKLLNNKTVWQNVAFALEVIGTRRSTIKSLVPKVLETVGLTGKEKNYPHELSGGEAQRVAIARAYVNHPQILLADEPTGNLDPTTSLGIMEVLDAINRTGTTIVMATHNEEIVNSMRKRVVELHAGKIVRDEAKGSYDSARYFPDAEVESKAKRVIDPAASKFKRSQRPVNAISATSEQAANAQPVDDRSVVATQAMDAVTDAVANGTGGNEGIARLANAMHSGRTGRYGEVFQPAETTMTWGKGLTPEEMTSANKPVSDSKQDGQAGKSGQAKRPGRGNASSSSAAGENTQSKSSASRISKTSDIAKAGNAARITGRASTAERQGRQSKANATNTQTAGIAKGSQNIKNSENAVKNTKAKAKAPSLPAPPVPPSQAKSKAKPTAGKSEQTTQVQDAQGRNNSKIAGERK
ncbi:cell division ATP-binding protein FtsE [Bifidobacterium sp. ESL0798]|uniref:cell division ATP-binding protein FtsE n=1 Tax=Bifidobacterium sp. ESL0798 TaxID=2983235 RepID=UPI0023F63F3A|nr:cell division ATP-binding protein FtsE [Bifidobacterium sp. ESL0798]WEV74525.1 cell division ATP-binding protein FtsE [Bifidobacterium sp. ESL0798]